MKKTLKNIGMAIFISMALFLLSCVILDFAKEGEVIFTNHALAKMILGTILIGIGFGLPAFIYEKEAMPMILRVVIHMGIGCIVMVIVSSAIGWIPKGHVLPVILSQVAVAFFIWLGFYLHNKSLIKAMNRKIKEANLDNK